MNHHRPLAWRALLGAAALVYLAGCPRFGEVCGTGQQACSVAGNEEKVCVDTTRDSAHCGGCGNVCDEGETCSMGGCVCAGGFTRCGDTCVNLQESATSCGACGTVCGAEQVCDQGQCKVSCADGKTQCGQSCVDLATSEAHCGACDRACTNATSCHAGTCEYDVVVSCFNNGQLVGIQAGTDALGPARNVGTMPLALAPLRDVVLSADNDETLYQVTTGTLSPLSTEATVGSDARSVLVDEPSVYVVNSITGTLSIFDVGDGSVTAADGGVGEGHPLTLREEVPMSTTAQGNTYPHDVARLGNVLYVSLHGGFDQASWSAGQKIARIDVSNPSAPRQLEPIDLMSLDLHPDEGATTYPRPSGILARNGKIYVALANLQGYSTAGAPLVARYDPADGGLDTIDLGRENCLGATELTPAGDRLLVGCSGKVEYTPPTWEATVSKSAVVLLDADDSVASAWHADCPADAGSCAPPVVGRLAVAGNDVYVTDTSKGRVFVLELDGGTLVERRGFASGGGALDACPAGAAGYSWASDVVVIP